VDKGYITPSSAAALKDVVKYYRGVSRLDGQGHPLDPDAQPTSNGPWLGKCQQAIPQGTSGPVNFMSGAKGGEADSGITIQAYSRFVDQPASQIVVFDEIDQGYEVIYPNQATNSGTGCNCGDCIPSNSPTVTGCSNCNPAATYWSLQFDPFTIPTCCTDCQYTGPILLQNNTDCTWTSGPIVCNGQTTLWTLTIADPVTLILSVPQNSGGSAGQIEYRTPLTGFSGLCTNTMYLWQPTNLPQMPRQPGQAQCTPPCEICLVPWAKLNCGECNTTPSTATVNLFGATGPVANFNGTTTCTGSNCVFTGTAGTGTITVTLGLTGNSPNEIRQYTVQLSTVSGTQTTQIASYSIASNALPCDTYAVTVGNLTWQAAQTGTLPSTISVTLHL
jgi:hypothetical protein